ncbi:MAG: Wzz/FepE/Etk N-terminal domain-containing protein, partial [Bacteroidota bacterium]
MADQETNHTYNDEITLKELILKIQEYFWYLWGKKWWIIAAGLIGGAIGFYRAWTTPLTYTAELTFMVNEDDGANAGGVGAILGQFGLGGGATSEYNLDKILALSRSRRIIREVLFDSVEINSEADLIANHI